MNIPSPMLLDIFVEIANERARQDELHPWDGIKVAFTIDDEADKTPQRNVLDSYRRINDNREAQGIIIVDSLVCEELLEAQTEEDELKADGEIMQAATVLIRYLEWRKARRIIGGDANRKA